jgi:hypothetical protein
MIDDEMLARLASGDGSISEGFDSVIPLAAEVLRLRAQVASVRAAWAAYLDAPASCYGVAYQGMCDALGVDGGPR